MSVKSDQPLNIVVLKGGPSAEAEVSRNSAAQVDAALAQSGHIVRQVELGTDCATELLADRPDVVFPALHGPPGEDGTVQGFLEMLGLPYVGSDVRGSALAMDKAVAKQIFARAGLPVAADCVVRADQPDLAAEVKRIHAEIGASVVIKPLNQGSAIGVTLMPNGGDPTDALQQALIYGDCLVEPFVLGREITVGVLQQDSQLIAHPVIEIRTGSDEWYDYENRYAAGKSEHLMPAPLPEAVASELQRIAVVAHRVLGLRDLSRADFVVADDDAITLLEVNVLPGMTPTSLYPEGAAALGYDFAALVDFLVRQAYARGVAYKS